MGSHGLQSCMSKTDDPDVTVLEYTRLEDEIEARIRHRASELEATELAETLNIDIKKTRLVLERLSQQYACLQPEYGDSYNIVTPEEQAAKVGESP